MLRVTELKEKSFEKNNETIEKNKSAFNLFKLSLKDRNKLQEKVLTTKSNKYLVKGPAGSGKTIIALNKAYQMMRDGDEDFALLIYTKALHKFLKGIVKKNSPGNVAITNKIFYEEEMKNDDRIDTDFIIIDEVQDFNINELHQYLDSAKKGYFLYGDNGQQIYPEKTENKNIIAEIEKDTSIEVFNLDRTYRVPQNIAEFAACIDKRNSHIDEDCYRIEGDIPQIIEFSSVDQEIKYICKIINNESWKNVGILLKKNEDVKRIAALLNQNGIICEQKSDDIDTLDFSTTNPKVMTYHSSKGLEFERVFIPECSFNKKPEQYNYREALFVAITRAKETVIISYIQGDKDQYLQEFDNNTFIFRRE